MSDESTEMSWSKDIHDILSDVLLNCDELQQQHKMKYLTYKSKLIIFRIPLIILSSVNSVFSVGLSLYLSQETTSVVNCLISLLCAMISAIELFMGIHKKMEQSLVSYHGFKLLSIKVATQLKLDPSNRETEGIPFLTEVMNEYRNLYEGSNVIRGKLADALIKRAHVIQNPLTKEIEIRH